MALFMNGAQGGMVTADNRNLDQPRDPQRGYWNDAATWEECLRIGQLMADEALRIVKDAPEQKDPALFCDADQRAVPGRVDADVGRDRGTRRSSIRTTTTSRSTRGSTSSTSATPRS